MFADLLTNIVAFQGDLFRNMKTSRESTDCYDDLGDDERDTQFAVLSDMEGHAYSRVPFITRPFEYGTAISISFLQDNWQKTRFSDGHLYGD
jgi:hypothetical protein